MADFRSPAAGAPAWLRLTGLLILGAAVAGWLALALRVVNPIVVWDEVAYLVGGVDIEHSARLYGLAPELPQYGNFLFMRLIQAIDAARLPVEPALKALNTLCVAMAAGLLGWWTWGRVGRLSWLALFFVACIYPTASYAAYIMPEAVYAGLFAMIWCLATRGAQGLMVRWCVFAAGAGVMTMIKVHALFLFIAWQAATLVWVVLDREVSWRKGLQLIAAATAVFALFAWATHGLTAPPLSQPGEVIGHSYQKALSQSAPTLASLSVAVSLLPGYVAAVLLLFAPTLCFLTVAAFSRGAQPAGEAAAPDLKRFQAIFLLGLLALILAVTCQMLSWEPNRIHLRYAGFVFPWMLGLAAIWNQASPQLGGAAYRRVTAVLWLAATAYFVFRLHDLRPLPVDAPELFFAHWNDEFGPLGLGAAAPYVIAGLFGGAAVLMLVTRINWLPIQLGVLILVLPLSIWNLAHAQARLSQDEVQHVVGEAARTQCAPGDVLALVTKANGPWVYRAFYGLRRATQLTVVEPSQLPMAVAAAPAGSCLLTSSPVTGRPATLLASQPGVWLYRLAK